MSYLTQGWLQTCSSATLGATLALVIFLSITIGRWSLYASLTTPFKKQIEPLRDLLAAVSDDHERIAIQREIDRLKIEMCVRASNHLALRRRSWTHISVLAVCYLLAITILPTPAKSVSASIILTAVWFMAIMDMEHKLIPESTIYATGLFCGLVTLVLVSSRWTTPSTAFIGAVAICCVIGLSLQTLKLLRKIRGYPNSRVLFGSGDILLLLAISFYVGVDIVMVLFFSCVVMVFVYVSPWSYTWLAKNTGHFCMLNDQGRLAGLPFVPAIFVGLVLTFFLPRSDAMDFNRIANFLYTSATSASLSWSVF